MDILLYPIIIPAVTGLLCLLVPKNVKGVNPVRDKSTKLSANSVDMQANRDVSAETVEITAANGRPISNGVKEALVLIGATLNLILCAFLFDKELLFSAPWGGFGFDFSLRL